jgi:hypothetical protein
VAIPTKKELARPLLEQMKAQRILPAMLAATFFHNMILGHDRGIPDREMA